MTSYDSQLKALSEAAASVATCTPAVSAALRELLAPKDDARTKPDTKTSKSTQQSRPKSTDRPPSTDKDIKGPLTTKDKATLATQIVNVTLKSLSIAARAVPTPATDCASADDEVARDVARKSLRRSSSAPLTPLQPRSLNRVPSSPVLTKQRPKSPVSPSASLNLLATVECAHLAFATLRSLVVGNKVKLPERQLEQGKSLMIGRLITLELHEQALKELRLLRQDLQRSSTPEDTASRAGIKSKGPPQTIGEILNFGEIKAGDPRLLLILASQVQAVRILVAMKKPTTTEAVLPFIRHEHVSSPVRLLQLAAQETNADIEKITRHAEALSQALLSLAPSVSTKEDSAAVELRLSISPEAALEYQALGLEMRLFWWKLAKHKANVDRDILAPLSRCFGAFGRRSETSARSAYATCAGIFDKIHKQLQAQGLCPSTTSKSPLFTIQQILTTLAREAGNVACAVSWAKKLYGMIDTQKESAGKQCSIAAQLLSIQLRNYKLYLQGENLIQDVVTGSQGSLRGDASEIDELLDNICQVRKVATTILMEQGSNATSTSTDSLSAAATELLTTFVLLCPRFCVRWLGKPPDPKSSTKDFLRFEQRKQQLSKSIQQTLDSTLYIMKMRLEQNAVDWETLDSTLHDCLTFLEYMGDLAGALRERVYHVKISNFYYVQYGIFRKQGGDDMNTLRALRRSVDCIKYRPSDERTKAQLVSKLERLAELYKAGGKNDEALAALQMVRSSMVEDGVLATVAKASQTQSVDVAWAVTDEAASLSRVLQAISKLEVVWMDWTISLSEAEQAAALEQRLHFILMANTQGDESATLDNPTVDALLRIYIPTRFPVRRLRVLLRLLCASVGNAAALSEVDTITKDAIGLGQQGAPEEDAGLQAFLPHLRALYASVTGLLDSFPNLNALHSALSTWKAIVDGTTTKQDLEKVIDDVPGLLNHLQSVTDFLRLKGHDTVLATILELAAKIAQIMQGPTPEDLIRHQSSLALQYVNLGQASTADGVLQQASKYVEDYAVSSGEAVSLLQLAWADYSITAGSFSKAEEHLALAKVAFVTNSATVPRTRKKGLFAHAAYLQSVIALERGDAHQSLLHSRDGVRIVYQEWLRIEAEFKNAAPLDKSISDSSRLDETTTGQKGQEAQLSGPAFWKLFHPLIRGLTGLSNIYAHIGMYQETIYYAELAQKIATRTGSEAYMARCTAWMGTIYCRALDVEKSLETVEAARAFLDQGVSSYLSATVAAQVASVYRELEQTKNADTMLAQAEETMKSISGIEEATTIVEVQTKTANPEVSEKPVRATRRTVKAEPAKKPTRTTRTTRTATTTKSTKAKVAPAPRPAARELDRHIASLKATILVQRAMSLISRQEWTEALIVLDEVKTLKKVTGIHITELMAIAGCLVGLSLEQMASDPVFGIVQESTISFPSITVGTGERGAGDCILLTKSSPPRKGRAATNSQKERLYIEKLKEAQGYLLDAHSTATLIGEGRAIYRISSMLQNVVLLLSAASAKPRPSHLSAHATCSVELARNLTWRRERKALQLEKSSAKTDINEWPSLQLHQSESRRTSLGFSIDMGRFQKDYVDILPSSWNVLSISVSDNKHDLCITKLQAGHSPFVIRLPLERASSRDADSTIFNYQHGRTELLDIIERSNETCHDGRDFSVKGAKTAWWNEREELDVRLKDLLENIEQTWLGGFRGIFSPHQRRPDLFATFQTSFGDMLNKHLPSRQQVRTKRGKAAAAPAAAKVTLDPRVLELFIGLGDTSESESDFDEALTDLLYFVVDILQFHGERNAYDEIDFDSMVIDTLDALNEYHVAASASTDTQDSSHTILILDKGLHIFPWESMPCMQGLAVSRVPSLACLRRLVLEQAPPRSTDATTEAAPAGHFVSPTSGTYILNPGQDLPSTQATFSAPFATLLGGRDWTGIDNRQPTETEFETALASADILLYFGHGSGAQYIRGRTIRRLDKCRAAAFLMGCSSASLTDAGDFEVYGPVWNYMMAGCPAVIGTLWDVTDRDIDRYAGRTMEEWGLVPRDTFKEEASTKGTASKGRSKAIQEEQKENKGKAGGERTSLIAAVSKARNVCRFRYLNAAAVVAYGIPVYLDQ